MGYTLLMGKYSLDFCKFSAVKSRGPGGQNVNKVSSAVQLQWDFQNDPSLSIEEKNKIQTRLKNYISSAGYLNLRSDEYRDQPRNKDRVLEKLLDLITQALYEPKKRKPTKPTYGSQIKRKDKKRARGETKALRKKISYE